MLSRIRRTVADWLSSDPAFPERFVAALLVWGLPSVLFEYFVFDRWIGLVGPLIGSVIIAILLRRIGRRIINARSQPASD